MKMIKVGIIIFVCFALMVGLFLFVDVVIQKNYNTEKPTSGMYDVVVKYEEDKLKYVKDVYSDEEIQKIGEEYDRKIASGVFPIIPHLK